MLILLIFAVFAAFLIWARRRQQLQSADAERLKAEIYETQRILGQAERRAQQLAGFLGALHDHKVSPSASGSWDVLSEFVVHNVGLLLEADAVVMFQWNGQASQFNGAAARGLSPQKLAQLKFHLGEGVIGRAAQSRKPVTVEEVDPKSDYANDPVLKPPFVVIPLWVNARVQAVVLVGQLKEAVSPETSRVTEVVGKHLELVMENLDLGLSRDRLYGELVSTLRLALSAKDANGQHHADSCGALVRAMGKELHLPAMLIEQIEFGALLHDVGKLGIPETLLNKPEALSAEEYDLVKKHPTIGAQILCEVGFLKAVVPIVLYHHEWVNGQGYPEGLAGEEIPLGARIVSIVDAWDTMIHDQPYRPAFTKSNAVAELRQQAGTQFDPKLIDVFIHVMDKLERASSQTAVPAATPHA